jgi:hypothetical protein
MLTLLLGKLSYRLIETPARTGLAKARPSTQSVALILGLLTIATTAHYIKKSDGIHTRLPAALQEMSHMEFDYSSYREGRCLLRPEQTASAFSGCIDAPRHTPSELVLLWGDSYAAHLYPGLSTVAGSKWRIAQMTSIGCPPILGLQLDAKPHCLATNDAILHWTQQELPHHIILAGNWIIYDWKQVSRTVNTLKALGIKRIDLVGPAPMLEKNVSSMLLEAAWDNDADGHGLPKRLSRGLKPGLRQTDHAMKDYAQSAKINFISVYDILCQTQGCLAFVDEPRASNLIAWDNGHFTVRGSHHVASRAEW